MFPGRTTIAARAGHRQSIQPTARGTSTGTEDGAFMLWWLAAFSIVATALFVATRRGRLRAATSFRAFSGRWSACTSVSLDMATLAAGKRHGVELLEELGRGVFGKVFRGRFCDEVVAVKVLEFEVPARLAHTKLAEISIATSLRHPCVVQTHTVVVEVLREGAASQLHRRLSGGSAGSGADGGSPGSGYDALPSQVVRAQLGLESPQRPAARVAAAAPLERPPGRHQ
ncbi:hypothetical protein WJX81_003886 [Elliptochloris bilobata]|uniref:Protein kinase domain-containing protein n=1 Tax=Elliptochloris bilobata TaxID=381761 RepID=A0AAW1R0B2_9CHLO